MSRPQFHCKKNSMANVEGGKPKAVMHFEYAEEGPKYGILFICSLFSKRIDLE